MHWAPNNMNCFWHHKLQSCTPNSRRSAGHRELQAVLLHLRVVVREQLQVLAQPLEEVQVQNN